MCAGAVARMSASQSTAFGHCESREIFRLSRSIDEVAEGRINASQMDLTIEEENVPEEAEDGHLLR